MPINLKHLALDSERNFLFLARTLSTPPSHFDFESLIIILKKIVILTKSKI